MNAESFSSLRSNIINDLRKELHDFLYAPGFSVAMRAEGNNVRAIVLDYASLEDISMEDTRRIKRAIRKVYGKLENVTLSSLNVAADERSFLDFHELNDQICSALDNVTDHIEPIFARNELFDESLNTLHIECKDNYIVARSDLFFAYPDNEGIAERGLYEHHAAIRIGEKETLFGIEKKEGFKYFPGSYILARSDEDLVAVAFYYDLFSYPEGMERAEAEEIITSYYKNANDLVKRVFSEMSISRPLFYESPIRPSNPATYTHEFTHFIQEKNKNINELEDSTPFEEGDFRIV